MFQRSDVFAAAARVGLVGLAVGLSASAAFAVNVVEHRGKIGQRFTFECPAGMPGGSVWGTGVYTDDSDVCRAAVHDGRIDPATGGKVTVEIRAGQASYEGVEQHGVGSSSYGAWTGSFVFVQDGVVENRAPIAPGLIQPANTYDRPLALDPAAPRAQLTWQLAADPDNDRTISWLDLQRWNADEGVWEPIVGEYIDGTTYALEPPDLQYGTYYAWRVFAVDPEMKSTQWYTPSDWSVFLTSPAPGDDWVIEIEP